MGKPYIKTSLRSLTFLGALLLSTISFAQNSVSIGTDQINTNAVLWLQGNGSQGFILPVVNGTGSISGPETGMVVFDQSSNTLQYFNGTAWVGVGSGSGGGTYGLTYSNGVLTLVDGGSANQITVSLLGDVTGDADATTVTAIQGRNVASTVPSDTQVLAWNASNNQWEPTTIGAVTGDGWGSDFVNTDGTLTGDGTSGNSLGVNSISTSQISDISNAGSGSIITNAERTKLNNITGTNTGDEVLFNSTTDGIVPAPGASTGRVLQDDGTWVTVSGSGDMLQSVYDINTDNIVDVAATVTTNANLTGPVTSTGNTTAIANGTITNAMLANSDVANLSGTNTGDEVIFNSSTAGLVPAPGASTGRVLQDDGNWVTPSGGGDLISANNLSDVANTATSRINLGLGTLATQNGTVSTDGLLSGNSNANIPTEQAVKTYVDTQIGGVSVVEVDGDPSNEIQNLTLTSNTLALSGSTPPSVDLSGYLDNTDAQNLSLAGASGSATSGEAFNLNISGGTGLTLTEGTNIAITRSGTNLTIGSTVASSGEANTASNQGTGGTGVFKQKTGVDLEFKNISAASNLIQITDDTGNDEIDIDVNQSNLSIANTQVSGLGTISTQNANAVNITGGTIDGIAITNSSINSTVTGNGSGLTNINAVQLQGTNITGTLVPNTDDVLKWNGTQWTAQPDVTSGSPTTFGGAGVPGIVPDPVTETGRFLSDDGSWATPPGGGDLLSTNNLSDLTDVATARTNLALGDMAVQNSGSVNVTGGALDAVSVTNGTFSGDGSGLTGITATVTVDGATITGDGSGGSPLTVGTIGSGQITDGAISSADIANGTIANIDISASAAIAVSKISGLVDNDATNEIQNLSSVLTQGNSAGNAAITTLADPTNPQDAATMNYVDTQISGIPTLPATTDAQIIVSNGTTPSAVSMGGDVFINNAGQTAIQNDAVTTNEIGTAGLGDADKVLTTDASGNPQWELKTSLTSGLDGSTTNELVTDFSVVGGNLELTDAGGTYQVPLSSIDTDDQTAAEVSYDNGVSGLTATDVKSAIDEVQSNISSIPSLPGTTDAQIIVSNGTTPQAATMSGDVTINNTGVTTISADAIGSAEITNLSITNNDISASAAITVSKISGLVDNDATNEIQNLSSVLAQGNSAGNAAITTLADPTNPQDAATMNYVDTQISGIPTLPATTDAQIIVSNGTTPTATTMSGDLAINNLGVTTVQLSAGNSITSAINDGATTGTVNLNRITTPGGVNKGVLTYDGTNNTWLTTATANKVFGTDQSNALAARGVILSTAAAIDNSGVRTAGTATDANLVSEAAVREAIDAAAGGSLQTAYDGGSTILLDGTNELSLSSSAGSVLIATDDTNQRVGFGTSSPTYFADFVSPDFGATNSVMRLTSLNTNTHVDLLGSATGTGAFRIGSQGGTNALIFQTAGNNDRVTINATGNVGIGTSNPLSKFQVENTLAMFYDESQGQDMISHNIYEQAAGDFRYTTNGGSSIITLSSERIGFFTFPTNTAGTSVSGFTTRMNLTDDGLVINGDNLDASAVLDINSTTKGMLIPRMTTAERDLIGSPATSLMIFNTSTNGFNYYDGTSWTGFGGESTTASNGLTLTGSDVQLGGTLSKITTVDVGTFGLAVGSVNTISGVGAISIGSNNSVSGNRAVAIGNYADANHVGTMVLGDWSGSSPATTASSTSDQFTARFSNGYRFYTTSDLAVSGGIYFANAGNVGLGIASPTVKLDISGIDAIRIPVGTTAQRPVSPSAGMIRFNSTDVQYEGYDGSIWSALGGGSSLWTDASPDIYFNTGNVGIGTTASSTSRLNVLAAQASGTAGTFTNNVSGISGSGLEVVNQGTRSVGNSGMRVQNLVTKSGGSGSTKIGLEVVSTGSWSPGTGQDNVGLSVTVAGADDNYAALFSGGNVGIGTSTPSAALHIVPNSTSYSLRIDQGSTGDGILTYVNTTSNTRTIFSALSNATGGLRVMGDGYVGVGRTSPIGASKFDVESGASGSNYGGMYINTSSATAQPFYGYANNGSSNTWTYLDGNDSDKWKVYNSGDRLTVQNNGNVGINTTSPASTLGVAGGLSIGSTYASSQAAATGELLIESRMSIGDPSPGFPLEVHGGAGYIISVEKEDAANTAYMRFMRQGAFVGSITETGGTTSYNAFTGSHIGRYAGAIPTAYLVSMTGDISKSNQLELSEAVYEVKITSKENDPTVLGAYLHDYSEDSVYSIDKKMIMAVGNGYMWVADDGKDLKTGDYLISSSVEGHAILDNKKHQKSYVIGRVAENVNWSDVNEFVDGQKHKLVSVFYENFVIDNTSDILRSELEEYKAQTKILESKIEAMSEQMNSAGDDQQELVKLKAQVDYLMKIMTAEASNKKE